MAFTDPGRIPVGMEPEEAVVLTRRARAGNSAAFRALANLPPHIQQYAWSVDEVWDSKLEKAQKDHREKGSSSLSGLIKANPGGFVADDDHSAPRPGPVPQAVFKAPQEPAWDPRPLSVQEAVPDITHADIIQNLRNRASGPDIHHYDPAEREFWWQQRERQQQARGY